MGAAAIDTSVAQIEVVRRAARIGAEIRNIKLSGGLPDQVIAAIHRLLLEHKVIFFRDQSHLDDAEQQRFAVRLGKLVPHPLSGATIGEFDSARGCVRADLWHADGTFLDAYFKILVLRGVAIPQFGGDTIWSNTAAAYLDLPQPCNGLRTNFGPSTATLSITKELLAHAKSIGSILTRSSPERYLRPSIPSCESIRKPASARWCSAVCCKISSIFRNMTAKSYSIYCNLISLRPKTLRGGAGRKEMLRSGTTA